jgi:hypothetical protein
MSASNIYDNTLFDAKDTVAIGPYTPKLVENNYWGTSWTAYMDSHPFAPGTDIPNLVDRNDAGAGTGYALDYTSVSLTAVANAPDSGAPTFLMYASPNLTRSPGSGLTTFTLQFSKAMNTAVQPTVTFGIGSPYAQHTVDAAPGWLADGRTWQGTFGIQSSTGDGLNTIRVANAKDAGGFVIPDDTHVKFVISAKTLANNGIVTITSGYKLRAQWSELGKTASTSYFVQRSLTETSGENWQTLNPTTPITVPKFTDTTAQIGTEYKYRISTIDKTDNSGEWTPASGPVVVSDELDYRFTSTYPPAFEWHKKDKPTGGAFKSFDVFRSTSPTGPFTKVGADLIDNAFTDNTAAPATPYYYQVFMNYNWFGDPVDWTDVFTTPPAAVNNWQLY